MTTVVSLPTDGILSKCPLSFSSFITVNTVDERHGRLILSAIKTVNSWEMLGVHLGLDYSLLEQIKIENFHQIETSRMHMIFKWLRGGTATCHDLLVALEEMGENSIVDELKQLMTLQ